MEIDPILESAYKVLARKVKIATLQKPLSFLPAVEFFDCFYF